MEVFIGVVCLIAIIVAVVYWGLVFLVYIGTALLCIIGLGFICVQMDSGSNSASIESNRPRTTVVQETGANKEYLKANDQNDQGNHRAAKGLYLKSYNKSVLDGDKTRALGGLIVVCDLLGEYSEARDYISKFRRLNSGSNWLSKWISKKGDRYE